MIKDWHQADFVEVIYILSDVLAYITELTFVFQELEFDIAIVQVLVNHWCRLRREVKMTATIGWETAYITCNVITLHPMQTALETD